MRSSASCWPWSAWPTRPTASPTATGSRSTSASIRNSIDRSAAGLLAMEVGEFGEGRHLPVRLHRLVGGACGAEVAFGGAPVDPGGGEAGGLGRDMIGEQALGRVQQALLSHAENRQALQQDLEVARRRLVGADVLGGDDEVEFDSEPAVAVRERGAVYVRGDGALSLVS